MEEKELMELINGLRHDSGAAAFDPWAEAYLDGSDRTVKSAQELWETVNRFLGGRKWVRMRNDLDINAVLQAQAEVVLASMWIGHALYTSKLEKANRAYARLQERRKKC